MTMLHLSRLAEDWILYSSEEFGWLELGDGVTSGSSLMPQKKNPDSLELIRGKCGRVFGDSDVAVRHHEGPADDLQSRHAGGQRAALRRPDQLTGSLEMAQAVAESVKLKPAVPAAAAEESWVVATDLAEALARRGVPFHQAHQIVGRLVLESVRAGKKPSDWTAEALAAFAPEFTPDMARLLVRSRRHEDARVAGRHRAECRRDRLVEREEPASRNAAKASGEMNKSFRQGQILKLIRAKEIYTQDELARELNRGGIQTTQVTLSRDMRELGLVKTADGYRQLNADSTGPELTAVVNEYLLDVRLAQNLVVLRTLPGNANTLAIAIDRQEVKEVVGTIAGDDTVLVIAPDNEFAESFRKQLLAMLSA